MQYFPTSHRAEVDGYPYGRLRTTAYFGSEFKPGKGFRTTFQTICPKSGRVNKVKNSTYYPIMLKRVDEETGHYKYSTMNPNSNEGVNKSLDFVCENFQYFTPDELKYIVTHLSLVAKAGLNAIVVWCGADVHKVLEIGGPSLKSLLACIKEPTLANLQAVRIDCEGLEALKVDGFSPFKITKY